MNGVGCPSTIYIIRHAEKPEPLMPGPSAVDRLPELTPPMMGVTCQGEIPHRNPAKNSSLSVRGWQRAGALAVLFARMPDLGGPVSRPDALVAAGYGRNRVDPVVTGGHRPYETLQPLAGVLDLEIHAKAKVGQEPKAMRHVLSRTGVVLICWEHHHLFSRPGAASPPTGLVAALTVVNSADLPAHWGHRFDVVWCFEVVDAAVPSYRFRIIPQRLLALDSPSPGSHVTAEYSSAE